MNSSGFATLAHGQPSLGRHALQIEVRRRLYLDAHGNVVHLLGEARLDDVVLAGLHPVLVYALIVEGVGFAYLRLAPWDAPLAIGAFLRSAWSGADGFGYCPSILKCGPRFFDALPCLATYCHDAGVELRITSPTDRSYNRNLHSAQSYVSDAAWYVDRPANGGAPVTLAAYETRILQNALHEPMPALSLAKRTARAQYHAAIKRPCPSFKTWPTVLDFDLGPWLFGNHPMRPPPPAFGRTNKPDAGSRLYGYLDRPSPIDRCWTGVSPGRSMCGHGRQRHLLNRWASGEEDLGR